MEGSIRHILSNYNLEPGSFQLERIGSGHIHDTFKLSGPKSFVLQRFNDKVFTRPDIVQRNIRLAADHLHAHHPDYLFVAPLAANNGETMIPDEHGHLWRIFDYVGHSYSIDEASTVEQAYLAASAFGRLGRLLSNCDVAGFLPTIDRFHDLAFRYRQFLDELNGAGPDRQKAAADEIADAMRHSFIVTEYETLISKGVLRQGIFHNDTKINNVLFSKDTDKVIAVVDLDTLMPGYFIYDLGDLVRTIVSPVSEEEKDACKIEFRPEFYRAIIEGYLSEMKDSLLPEERSYLSFAGQMMTYIMALRFLADFLRGDTYYNTTYPGQNLVRARNQFRLLNLLIENAS